MPPKAKYKISNQQDKRHDTGLAAPGRRVSKDRAVTAVPVAAEDSPIVDHSAVASSVKLVPPGSGKIHYASSQYRLPSTGLNQGLTFPRPAPLSIDIDTVAAIAPQSRQERHDSLRDGKDVADVQPGSSTPNTNTRSASAQSTSTLQHFAAQANHSLGLASTILVSFPLRDAMALLIIFLSLPPTLVFAVQGLFAAMGVSPTNLSGLSESFYAWLGSMWSLASPGGAASPITIVFIDVVVAGLYLGLPSVFQDVLMDVVHAVIALSLSGTIDSPLIDSIFFCAAVGAFLHLYRYESLHRIILQNFSWITACLGFDLDAYALLAPYRQKFDPVTVTSHGWPRVLLGCHILAQGIFSMANRHLAGVSRPQQESKATSEGTALIEDVRTNGTGPRYITTDITKFIGGMPTPTTFKDRLANSKERRKYANQIRSQQPLWAAIASTKITFLKELEQKKASEDALETANLAEPSGILPLAMQDRVEVRGITSTSMSVAIELVTSEDREATKTSHNGNGAPITEQVRPFIVRLNGAIWTSSRILHSSTEHKAGGVSRTFWEGEIYGLTPLTKYGCDVLRRKDLHVIGSVNLITLPSAQAETGPTSLQNTPTSAHAAKSSPASTPTQQPALRPLSPASTLRQSLEAAEVKRDDLRTKVRRIRKEQKAAVGSIRRDIETIQSKLATLDATDDKNKSRLSQLERNIKQADETTKALLETQQTLESIPAEEAREYMTQRQAWEAAQETKAAAMNDTNGTRARIDREIASFATDLAALEAKRSRLVQRREKLDEQIEQMESQQARETHARQQHDQDRAALIEERDKAEIRMSQWIHDTQLEVEKVQAQANEYFQQADVLRAQMQRRQQSIADPISPEGVLPSVGSITPFDYDRPKPLALGNGDSPDNATQISRGHGSSMPLGYNDFTDELEGMVGYPPGLNGRPI